MISNDGFNKKIVLELTKYYKKDYKIGCIILTFITALLIIFLFLLNIGWYEKLGLYIFCMLFIIMFIYFIFVINTKVEIYKGIITKYYIFKIKKVVGKLSDITSFSTFNKKAIVYKNKFQKMFSFEYKISKTHKKFYQYLMDNFNDEIPIYRYKPVYISIYIVILLYSFFIFGYLYFINQYFLLLCILIPITFYFLIKKLNEPCLIINEKSIIYNGFLKSKYINLNNVTKIKFEIIRNYFHPDRSSINVTDKSYHFILFNKKNKLIKVRNIAIEDINRIEKLLNNKNIKIVRR